MSTDETRQTPGDASAEDTGDTRDATDAGRAGQDWSWVVDRPCPECGYDASGVALGEVAAEIRRLAPALVTAMAGPDPTRRPAPGVWSPLEYACHVRDVLSLFHDRLNRILAEDGAELADWDQEEAARTGRYAEAHPGSVAADVDREAMRAAAAYDAVDPGDAGRTGRRSDGVVFTPETLGRYLLHELAHHGWDVR